MLVTVSHRNATTLLVGSCVLLECSASEVFLWLSCSQKCRYHLEGYSEKCMYGDVLLRLCKGFKCRSSGFILNTKVPRDYTSTCARDEYYEPVQKQPVSKFNERAQLSVGWFRSSSAITTAQQTLVRKRDSQFFSNAFYGWPNKTKVVISTSVTYQFICRNILELTLTTTIRKKK